MFSKQCLGVVFFGGYLAGMTDRWGPIASLRVQLPPGKWIRAISAERGLDFVQDQKNAYYDGPHRYVDLSRTGTAYLAGEAKAFLLDSEIVLKLRAAPPRPPLAPLNYSSSEQR